MMSASDWPSTHGLSVYNALSLSGRDMTPGEILDYLRAHFDAQFTTEAVNTGIEFLLARGYVRRVGAALRVARWKTGTKTRAAWPLVRTQNDRELTYG